MAKAQVLQFRPAPRPEALHSWDAPDWSILDDRRGSLPEFPLDGLGALLREWVERAAAGAGVTPAHVAVPALGIASSLVGMARRVRASSSWLEPMTCWVGIRWRVGHRQDARD